MNEKNDIFYQVVSVASRPTTRNKPNWVPLAQPLHIALKGESHLTLLRQRGTYNVIVRFYLKVCVWDSALNQYCIVYANVKK